MGRPLLASLAAALVLLTTSACLNTEAPLTPSPAVSASETAASPTASPTTTATSATPSPTTAFPATARLYAEAVLLAWRTKQYGQLGELTTAAVLSQLQTTANVEPNWAYVSCQGAAGSSYCMFINADGDAVTLRLDNQLLGRARATTEVKLDQTTYSNNAVEYVKAFIEAWRNANTKRMAALANQGEVEYFTHYTPPGTYFTCATLSAGTASVRVYNPDGLNYTLTVSVATLGSKHAITGHAAVAAACP
jgi:hypothetical protein